MITDWLLEQVSFAELNTPEIVSIPETNTDSLAVRDRQIKQLRSQVKLLSSMLLASILVFGGSFTWLVYELKVGMENTQVVNFNRN